MRDPLENILKWLRDRDDIEGIPWPDMEKGVRDAYALGLAARPEELPLKNIAYALREFAGERQVRTGQWDSRSQRLVEWAVQLEDRCGPQPSEPSHPAAPSDEGGEK